MTKKNPRARRNHHLVVGERVKLSDEGWAYLKGGGHFDLRPWEFEKNTSWRMGSSEEPPYRDAPLTASTFRRSQTEILGDVVGVTNEPVNPSGYFIVWDGEKKDAWVADKYVVSANSTTRKWPGDHYEGIPPKKGAMKKNPNDRRRLHRARRRAAEKFDAEHGTGAFVREMKAGERRLQEEEVRKYESPEWQRSMTHYLAKGGRAAELVEAGKWRILKERDDARRAGRYPQDLFNRLAIALDFAPEGFSTIVMRENPRARRNHHLVVGEPVKWSTRALEGYGLDAYQALKMKGVVRKVLPDGYMIELDHLPGRSYFVGDKDVVSASSTTRKWPGNHYEGVDPMAKKNRRKARRNMAIEAHGKRFDTVPELIEYERLAGLDPRQGGAQHRPAELAVAAAHATPEFQQMEREMQGRVRGMGTGVRKKSPMMFPQLTDDNWRYKGAYDAVSYYLGGQKQYAPELKAEAKKKRKKLANVGALMHMGLTPDMAFAFLSEMGSRYPSTTQEGPKGKPQIVASEITPEIQAEARAVLLPQLSGSTASSNPRGAPLLAPSPFIGYPSDYNMPANAGPYQPQIFPYGVGGRPATYQYESVKQVLEHSPTGPAGGPNIRAARNPRYSIPLQYPKWEFDVWAPQPTMANWTSYPPYSYKQFYRQNPRETREGYIKYGSGPLGGLTAGERKSIPSHMFLEPKKRSFPVPDRNHAWIAVQYMTRFHIPNAPTLIRRLAKFYPPADHKNGRIWERYHRLRGDIEKMSGKKMPTLAQLARSRAVANSILRDEFLVETPQVTRREVLKRTGRVEDRQGNIYHVGAHPAMVRADLQKRQRKARRKKKRR